MNKREQKFTTKFIKWLIHEWQGESCGFEPKVAKNNNALPFSAVQPNQITALKLCAKTFAYKISDMDRMEKPLDVVCLRHTLGFVVIHWHRRGNKEFVLISIDEFLEEKENSTRKSLTEKRAKEIGLTFTLK